MSETDKEIFANMKKKDKFLIIIQIISILFLIYSSFHLYKIYKDYNKASEEYKELSEEVIINNNNDDYIYEDNNEIIYSDKYYIDLKKLKEKNKDTVGWIILPNTKINYPIVKSKDNDEYLSMTFEGQYSSSGAIFMDMNCNKDFNNKNTIIYGHNMKNGSMFRCLNNLTDEEYFKNNNIFCIDDGNGFKDYMIISCYETTSDDNESWKIDFESNEVYSKWLLERVNKSIHKGYTYDINKNTIMLSTCRGKTNGSERFVVYLQEK